MPPKKTLNSPGEIPKLPCFKTTPPPRWAFQTHAKREYFARRWPHLPSLLHCWQSLVGTPSFANNLRFKLKDCTVSVKWSCSTQHFVYHQKNSPFFEHIPTAMNQSSIPDNTKLPMALRSVWAALVLLCYGFAWQSSEEVKNVASKNRPPQKERIVSQPPFF